MILMHSQVRELLTCILYPPVPSYTRCASIPSPHVSPQGDKGHETSLSLSCTQYSLDILFWTKCFEMISFRFQLAYNSSSLPWDSYFITTQVSDRSFAAKENQQVTNETSPSWEACSESLRNIFLPLNQRLSFAKPVQQNGFEGITGSSPLSFHLEANEDVRATVRQVTMLIFWVPSSRYRSSLFTAISSHLTHQFLK